MNKIVVNQSTNTAHRRVQSSTTLNRKYVKRPVTSKTVAPEKHPIQVKVNSAMKQRTADISRMRNPQINQPTAAELKNQAIKKALAVAERQAKAEAEEKKPREKLHFGFGRVFMALCCTAATVFAIAYFVNVNMPDISLKVTAIQTGIEAKYPSYIPRDYALSDITSENNKVSLTFKNSETEKHYTITEEKSSWDSEALLVNYVKPEFSNSFATVREQGLTIYLDNNKATWVNGGIIYKLEASIGALTQKQIKSIATSL